MELSLGLLKKHVRADDFHDDDAYLLQLLQTATETVIMATNRPGSELLELNHGFLPKPLQQAVLMLAAHWYNQRESVAGVAMQEVPYSIQALIKPYRKLV